MRRARASGCVNNRDRVFPRAARARACAPCSIPRAARAARRAGVAASFRGTVTYLEGFACPPAGRCHPPRGFPTRKVVVARFTFRVR